MRLKTSAYQLSGGNIIKKENNHMYKIIEQTTGLLITICEVSQKTRKELEECGFKCEKVEV